VTILNFNYVSTVHLALENLPALLRFHSRLACAPVGLRSWNSHPRVARGRAQPSWFAVFSVYRCEIGTLVFQILSRILLASGMRSLLAKGLNPSRSPATCAFSHTF
jgi:hypothetical protein